MSETPWSNLAQVVYKRTYARPVAGSSRLESWSETVARAVEGNVRGHNVPEGEVQRLIQLLNARKCGPAGRGYWFSGTAAHQKIGGVALNNCWVETSERWENFVIAQDLLMLGGGVGMTVEHKYTSKLPRVKKGVQVIHQATKDADFIVPDSREGWNKLIYQTLEAFFVTGRSFTYSTVCIRDYGTPIAGFGGIAAGARPLVDLVEKLSKILRLREGKHILPLDAADILCSIAEMVVSGNVRRSAILILGDAFDKQFLMAKRWDLGQIPTQRAMANFSVVCDDIEDLHPAYWKTYEAGEAFGLVNRKNMQKYGRMGELKRDSCVAVNPCGEATLEANEACNLQNIALPNLTGEEEFKEAAVLMHRWGKRVTLESYHIPEVTQVIQRNRRIGTSITGCLQSPLFKPEILDRVYQAIQEENTRYSAELGIPESVRTTTLNPGGTVSKVYDVDAEGLHGALSRYLIQRIRFSANDPTIPKLRDAGHRIEPVVKFDGSLDQKTLVVDFYRAVPDSCPVVDEGFDTWKQLDTLLMAQKHWSDQAVSVTVYYKKEEIPRIKQWLADNLCNIKTVSFMMELDHGFKQAPKEAISKEQYEKLSSKIQPVVLDEEVPTSDLIDDCAGGACPVR